MTSKEFLIKELNRLYKEIKGIKIKYQFDEIINAHLVEVLPKDIFENNENYIKLENAIYSKFKRKFSDEEILFISEDSLNKISQAEFQLGYEDEYSIVEKVDVFLNESKIKCNRNLSNNFSTDSDKLIMAA